MNRFWVLGDGAVDAATAATATHTYSASGTYHTALFVDNAAGSSSATRDVLVAAAAPIAVTISATTTGDTCWTFTCLEGPCSFPASYCNSASMNNVNLKVGQPYVITWTTPQSENKHHGLGSLGVLGITQCDDGGSLDNVIPSHPCTVTFTPTAAMLSPTFGGPVYTYHCTQTMCAPTLGVHNNLTGTITIVP